MVCIGTGINDGNPASCAGVPSGPSCVRTNHGGGGTHIGIGWQIRVHHSRLILRLKEDLFHTWKRFQGRNLTICYIGGNEVGRQCQIPDYVQFLSGDALNPLLHTALLLSQIGPVSHGSTVAANLLCRKPCFQYRFFLQNNGNTYHICTGMAGLCMCFRLLLQQVGRDSAVIHLHKADLSFVGARRADWRRKAPQQCQNQQ